jgi:RNA polymerase sigma factor (sigma-70 family)
MIDDNELLRRYSDERSEEAFTELVQRHVNLVYFAALRRVGGDAHLADDLTQKVFADLARKALSLKNRSVLTGWLYTSTRFAAAQAVRSERRRRTHEQEAQTMHELHSAQEPDWDQLRPMIDEAMDELNEREREAVLLRFFENQPLAEVGAKFSLSADAARMRVDRALEKLRGLLAKRGIVSTSAALAAAFVSQSAMAAPAGLAAKVVAGALSQTGVAATATLALWKVLAGVVVVGVGVGVVAHEVKRTQSPASSFVEKKEVAGTAIAALSTPAVPAPVNSAPIRVINEPIRVTSNQNRVRKTTDDFGWPQVGLFAGNEGEKPIHTSAEFIAKMGSDAEFRATVTEQAKEHLGLFYGYLFKSLNLPDSQLDQFKNLLVEKELLKVDTIEAQNALGLQVRDNRDVVRESVDQGQQRVDAEIKTVLGEDRYEEYLQYREDLVQWSAVNAVAQKLQASATPLTDEQADKLVVLLRSSLLRIKAPFTFGIIIGSGVYSGHIGSALTERVFRQAGEFLSAPQVEALRQLQRVSKSRTK